MWVTFEPFGFFKAEAFVEAVEEHNPDVLGLSALLAVTMPNMGKVIDLLKEKGLRDLVAN